MKNKRVNIAITLAIIVIIAVSAVSCNKITPYQLWSSAVKDIKNADSISADIELTYGGDSYSINAKHDLSNSARALEIKFSEDDIMKIYSDGKTNYYENGGLKYSSDNADDNPVVKELLSFALRDDKTLSFTKSFFSNAEFETGDKITLRVVAKGSDIKNAIAVDEDLEFSDKITLSAEFDGGTHALISVSIEGEVGGKEFYGLPLFKSGSSNEKTAFTAKITNISYLEKEISVLPENTSDYPNIPALAQINTSTRLMTLKKGVKSDISGTVKMSMVGMNMTIPFSGKLTVADNNGFTTTRTKIKVEMSLIGMNESQEIDTFTDGKSDYVYYTAENSEDCYKVLSEKDTSSEGLSQMTDLLKNPSDLQKYFTGAKVSKSGKDTLISVDLTAEQISELFATMNSDASDDVSSGIGDILGDIDMSDCSMKINMTINENGIMTKNSIEISISVSTQDGDTSIIPATSMDVSFSVDINYSDIYEDITPDIPEGYENYPEETRELIFKRKNFFLNYK